MDRGTDARVADAEPPFEQRLRAEGAEQRDVHRGCHDPPNTEAAGEGSMNLTKQALRTLLSGEDGIEVIAEAKDGHQALNLCRELLPDLVLMDVRMPVMDGLAATKKIKDEMPKTSVMMMTMHENPDHLFEVVKAGAAGYVLKGASGERLLSAVRRTLEGESPLNQELAMRLLVRLARESSSRSEEGTGGGSGEIWEGNPWSQQD